MVDYAYFCTAILCKFFIMTSFKRTTYIFISLFVLGFLSTFYAEAQRVKGRKSKQVNTSVSKSDSSEVDSLAADSLATDSVEKKEPIDAPVVYEASDSIVFTKDGMVHLYGSAKVNYQKIELTSAIISMSMDSSTVFARGVKDSTGVESGLPVFKDGETPYESKIMRYNFKTKKGFINSIVTQHGEVYVTSQDAKKNADDEIYMQRGMYTTCDNHDHPHFYLKMSMAKVRPKKNVVLNYEML